ncbi:MAG: hypothetical protein JWO15_3855 [Sphingomonadales bacterium]|nr:hypothetical protein [Sphingomonadales bacterium]
MTTTLTLAGFLLARIAEDEAVARDAFYDGQRWVPEEEAVVAADRDLDPVLFLDRKRDATHAANWSPARVLAECAAKRQIMNVLNEFALALGNQSSEQFVGTINGLRIAVKVLAMVYADHPDYDETWRA